MIKRFFSLLVIIFLFAGCETTLNETQTGALTGSAVGAGLGAIIGNQSGHPGAGTAIGAGAGALVGGILGEGIRRSKNTNAASYQHPAPAVAVPSQSVDSSKSVYTKFCPTCGRTYPDDAVYCVEDGTKLRYIE